ncbi:MULTISPECIES: hypothetical protein [unclassified Arthrobacter]|uniref:hypothetical protein n=1 Tax=unclassified Arthrobacter TaxID=235627 RepID=UPI000CE378B1|nr:MULTISPECIES: hypothetical protein [unclassified Arthrobacter]
MTTEPTGPANTEDDPLGPSAPAPEPSGDPRRPGQAEHPADNIRQEQGTSPGGTVPAGHSGKAPEDPDADRGIAPEEALADPESSDG